MNLDRIKKMDKGELHVHLNGLVSTETIKKIVQSESCEIPKNFDVSVDLNVLRPAQSLVDYLLPWQVLRLIPKNRWNLRIIVESAFENLKADSISFVEIRNSVIYLASLNNISVDNALFWLIEEIEKASHKYQIKAGLILTVSRGIHTNEHLKMLLQAYKNLGFPECVIGLDLAGNEDIDPPKETAHSFLKAKSEYGLKITIHAGETGNYENIRKAIIEFGADRIGHGTAASKSDEVMELLKDRDICLEVCPISNRLTKAVGEYEDHPVKTFIANDVPFVICSDNPAIHASSLSFDYYRFLCETNSEQHLKDMYLNQKKYSFLERI